MPRAMEPFLFVKFVSVMTLKFQAYIIRLAFQRVISTQNTKLALELINQLGFPS